MPRTAIYQNGCGDKAMTMHVESANENDVMREQIEYLIDHTAAHIQCGCSECRRYLRVRSILFEIFAEPQVQEFPKQAQAA
jgi:hypothetical protein